MAPMTFDAIVVGSGISGGWAAKELTEKGLRTIVLEAGRPIDPLVDYVEHVPPSEKRYRGMGNRKQVFITNFAVPPLGGGTPGVLTMDVGVPGRPLP